MTGLKVIDGTPTAISKYLREREIEEKIKEQEEQDILNDIGYEESKEIYDYTHR